MMTNNKPNPTQAKPNPAEIKPNPTEIDPKSSQILREASQTQAKEPKASQASQATPERGLPRAQSARCGHHAAPTALEALGGAPVGGPVEKEELNKTMTSQKKSWDFLGTRKFATKSGIQGASY